MHKISTIIPFIPYSVNISGNPEAEFGHIDSIFKTRDASLSWVKSTLPGAESVVSEAKCSVIICDHAFETDGKFPGKTFIKTENPAVAFMRVVKALHKKTVDPAAPLIHPSAIVHPAARLGNNVSIGAFSYVGNCTIGENSIIESMAKIHDGVIIGRQVLISEYCNIGGQGFGHIPNENGVLENMNHIGNVVIEDGVEIFPYSNVDRATLSTTFIGKNTKIDHYCHIGHNSTVGANNIITAKVVLCGGATVGNNTMIGVSSIIRDKLTIGDGVTIGMGSMVTKDIPHGETWAGNPARPLSELKKIQEVMKSLYGK